MLLDFTNVVVKEVVKAEKPVVSRAIPRNPEGNRIRLFKDGAVFPSKELVDQLDLEYQSKDHDSDLVPMGLDVIDSRKWEQVKDALTTPYIFVSPSPKSNAKVDLFSQVGYKEDGAPMKTVLEQGSKRPELIEMVREVYNLGVSTADQDVTESSEPIVLDSLFGDKNYVDLEIHLNTTLPTSTNIFHLPKTFSRGARKGEVTTERRENATFYPLTVVQDGE